MRGNRINVVEEEPTTSFPTLDINDQFHVESLSPVTHESFPPNNIMIYASMESVTGNQNGPLLVAMH
jgi:hypothetical protein